MNMETLLRMLLKISGVEPESFIKQANDFTKWLHAKVTENDERLKRIESDAHLTLLYVQRIDASVSGAPPDGVISGVDTSLLAPPLISGVAQHVG